MPEHRETINNIDFRRTTDIELKEAKALADYQEIARRQRAAEEAIAEQEREKQEEVEKKKEKKKRALRHEQDKKEREALFKSRR